MLLKPTFHIAQLVKQPDVIQVRVVVVQLPPQ